MCLALFEGEAVEEPLQLTAADGGGLFALPLWPAELAAFEAAVVEPEPVVIPVEDLDLVSAMVAEDEEGAGEEVELIGVAYDGGEAVDGFAQIGAAACEVDGGAVW